MEADDDRLQLLPSHHHQQPPHRSVVAAADADGGAGGGGGTGIAVICGNAATDEDHDAVEARKEVRKEFDPEMALYVIEAKEVR